MGYVPIDINSITKQTDYEKLEEARIARKKDEFMYWYIVVALIGTVLFFVACYIWGVD